ncbi:MAG: PilW family protein [Candidatus Nitrotoga sp.]|nr:PilW family protein [Candidatus Nitrotoga sp.]
MTINQSINALHPPVVSYAPRGERGFTLVEFMVASTIALLILVSVSAIFVSSMSSEITNASASEISTNGRYAIEILRRDLLHAGYRGLTWAPPSNPTTAIGAVTGDCSTGFSINLSQGVWGSNDSNPFSATCIPSANYSIGDVLVVRHAALTITPLEPNKLYVRSAYERGEVFMASSPPSSPQPPLFTQTPNVDYALESTVYYVSPFSSSSTETPQIPGLFRLALSAGPALTPTLMASNVEDMQIQYGRFTTDLNTQFYNADSISASVTPSQWNDVSTVRVWILVRATKVEPGYRNTSTYTLGDKTITVNDGFRREVFSTVIRLRNM